MTVAYFDCFSGIAGDMVLGAMIDAGMPLKHLEKELRKLGVGGYRLKVADSKKGGIRGVNFSVARIDGLRIKGLKGKGGAGRLRKVSDHDEHNERSFGEIGKLIQKSSLSKNIKQTALKIFYNLAEVEAKVHGVKISDVHFHEVGGIDSIVDIVGAAVGVDYFGFEKIYFSPLPVGRGRVKCAHGVLPVPAPATLELLKGIPVEPSSVEEEIVTPTGAAIVKTLASGFGASPIREIKKVGYGYGDKVIPGITNALRLMIGEGFPLIIIEANIDDMNPEFYPHIIEKLISAGALDATLIPVVMKKGRPGILLSVLCEGVKRKKLAATIINETTTFGVRYFPVEREITRREIKKVKTKWGTVRVKIAVYDGSVTTISPEYEDCRKIAAAKNIPLKEVYRQALARA